MRAVVWTASALRVAFASILDDLAERPRTLAAQKHFISSQTAKKHVLLRVLFEASSHASFTGKCDHVHTPSRKRPSNGGLHGRGGYLLFVVSRKPQPIRTVPIHHVPAKVDDLEVEQLQGVLSILASSRPRRTVL